MCIILIGNITRAQYKNALLENPDGFSLYTKELGLIKAPTKKEVDKAIGQFGIWHFRIATSGTKVTTDPYNIHPFAICNGEYYLYHNGVLGSGLGNKSDTHALADLLSSASLETAKTVVKSLSQSNRFVIANAHNNPEEYYLFGEWVCESGVLMSHKMYTYKSFKYTSNIWEDNSLAEDYYIPYKYRGTGKEVK